MVQFGILFQEQRKLLKDFGDKIVRTGDAEIKS